MINEKDFESMRKEFTQEDVVREVSIIKSREIIKLSKQIIYSVHRNDLSTAAKALKDINARVKELTSSSQDCDAGYFKAALQEYVEAAAFYAVEKTGNLPTRAELKVDSEAYLLGVADLSGELTRSAVNAVINEDYSKAIKVKELVSEIYYQLMQFDFRNGDLRCKFDRIKYDVKKLEDLALEIKIKGLTNGHGKNKA